MTRKNTTTNPWAKFHGPNLGYVIEQYDLYVTGAGSVDPELQELFEIFGAPSFQDDVVTGDNTATHFSPQNTGNIEKFLKSFNLLSRFVLSGTRWLTSTRWKMPQMDNLFLRKH